MTEYANILDRITEGRDLPDGCDRWGLKATDFAGRTHGDFQWPDHGWVEADSPDPSNTDACPIREGDGVCVGLTFDGIASGGHRALALLLVAFSSDDALSSLADGYGLDKVRVRRAFVVERLDGEKVVKAHGTGADLYGADMRGANLYGANLRRADLRGADMRGADMRAANLRRADLRRADLCGADMRGADMRAANLRRADLRRADLYGADMRGADMRGADMDGFTRWPEGFTPPGGAA